MLDVGAHVRTVVSTSSAVLWHVKPCILVYNTNVSEEPLPPSFELNSPFPLCKYKHFPHAAVTSILNMV
jgi:hypothetical protein